MNLLPIKFLYPAFYHKQDSRVNSFFKVILENIPAQFFMIFRRLCVLNLSYWIFLFTTQAPIIPTYSPNTTVINWTNTTVAMNSTTEDVVKEWRSCNHIFGTYVIPNMLHFFAYLIGFYHFRIQEHEGLYALMEKVCFKFFTRFWFYSYATSDLFAELVWLF